MLRTTIWGRKCTKNSKRAIQICHLFNRNHTNIAAYLYRPTVRTPVRRTGTALPVGLLPAWSTCRAGRALLHRTLPPDRKCPSPPDHPGISEHPFLGHPTPFLPHPNIPSKDVRPDSSYTRTPHPMTPRSTPARISTS
jgi:hypothetical protein